MQTTRFSGQTIFRMSLIEKTMMQWVDKSLRNCSEFVQTSKRSSGRRHICSRLSWGRGIHSLLRAPNDFQCRCRIKRQNLLPCDSFSLRRIQTFFFTVSGKSFPVSDLSQNEVGEVPHEALARDCHHRDEERDSGKTKTVHSL